MTVALLAAGGAQAAAFLPGQSDADPPTGDTGASRPGTEEPAVAGPGIRWGFAPWRWGGSLGLEAGWTKLDTGRTSTQGLLMGNVDFASYVWQPWFIQVRTGVGAMFSTGKSSGADSPSDHSGGLALTGRVQVSVFPVSRFPFSARLEVSDSRSTGETLLQSYRNIRLSVAQSWQPVRSSDNYNLNFDHSRVSGSNGGSDRLTLLHATSIHQWVDQTLDSSLLWSDNQRPETGDRTRNTYLNLNHNWLPQSGLNVSSLANWNDNKTTVGRAGSRILVSAENRQVASTVSWSPQPGDWLYSETSPTAISASARILESLSSGSAAASTLTRAINASAGVSHELSRQWRASAALSTSRFDTGVGTSVNLFTANATLNYVSDPYRLGDWSYTPAASSNYGLDDSGQVQRRFVGLQGSHGLSRSWRPSQTQSIAFNISQSAGMVKESPSNQTSRGLNHSMGLSWQGADASGGRTFVALSASDSRSRAAVSGDYQFINLQLTQRNQLSRFSSWSGSLTVQGSRSSADQIDPFTAELRKQDNGWTRFYSGALSYESQRAFGVPRLRFTALLTANSTQLERRSAGDIDAPLERVSESAEARLEYAIGRLDTRLTLRSARIEGATVTSISARAQRRF